MSTTLHASPQLSLFSLSLLTAAPPQELPPASNSLPPAGLPHALSLELSFCVVLLLQVSDAADVLLPHGSESPLAQDVGFLHQGSTSASPSEDVKMNQQNYKPQLLVNERKKITKT
jgi:hypothetical protein